MFSRRCLLALALSLGATTATPVIVKRWDTSLCTPENAGVPIPDSSNFQLPLEGLRQDVCRDFCVGDLAACTTTTQVCWDFHGTNLTFDYKPLAGYTYTEADIFLGLGAPSLPYTPQYNTANAFCSISGDATSVHCEIPYSLIVNSDDVLDGMCPNGESAGLVFYLYTKAMLNSAGTGDVEGSAKQSCSDYPTCSAYDIPYWELTYRCTNCPEASSSSSLPSSTTETPTSSTGTPVTTTESVSSISTSETPVTPTTSSSTLITTTSSSSSTTSAPTTTSKPTTTKPSTTTKATSTKSPTPTPTVIKTCPFGTAFGYSTNPKSLTFDSLSQCPSTCRRWGWYTKPSTAQLASGITGPLYVGAGGNWVFKATSVGTWKASVSSGKLYVSYSLASGYGLEEVHVDVGCGAIKTCSPGQYKYGTKLADGTKTFTTPGVVVPTCAKGQSLYLIVHAEVEKTYVVSASKAGSYKCPAKCAL